ncbi:MAG: hypothetical protein ACE5GH_02060 [Fidelibacterota bacterium]
MAAMNKGERFIYDRVKFHPHLKRFLTDNYQRLLSLVPRKDVVSTRPINVREGYFFGFHDKCPWSPDNSKLLAHRFTDPLVMPGPLDEVEVGYFAGEDTHDFTTVGRTRAWNWQTGSMLQWLGNSPLLIFNDVDGDGHISKVVDSGGKVIRSLPGPIAAVSPDGYYALSYSFVRLHRRAPAYGYANGTEAEENDPVPDGDGLYIMETGSGVMDRLFSVAEIANTRWESSMAGSYHYFTHCLFSPSGKRFAFYHRWTKENGRTWTRLLSCGRNGNDLFIFPTSGVVTHMAWRDDETLLAYGSTEARGDHYYLFRDRTGESSVLGEKVFTSDGHPQFSPDGGKVITDTYPNRWRFQYLMMYDLDAGRRTILARIHSPFKYRHDLRCDLHPRWDREGTMICFDSSQTGIRALCTMKL